MNKDIRLTRCPKDGGQFTSLSVGSTPIDFAYRIHTDIGNHCSEAKVNGKKVPLNTPLQNGDTIEIITRKTSCPKLEWLRVPTNPEIEHPFIKSSKTRSKVKQWFRKKSYDESVSRGQELLEQEIGKTSFELLQRSETILAVAKEFNYPKVDGLLAALGYGVISLQKIINGLSKVRGQFGRNILIKELGRQNVEILENTDFYLAISDQLIFNSFNELLIALGSNRVLLDTQLSKRIKDKIRQVEAEYDKTYKNFYRQSSTKPYIDISIDEKYVRWIIGGEEGIPYRFAPCCQICLCGDNIGVVKRASTGIVIHSRNCRNLRNVLKGRLIEVTNAVSLEIQTSDRIGMERDVADCFVEQNLNVRAGSVKTFQGKKAVFLKSITLSNLDDVKSVQDSLIKLRSMHDVESADFVEKKIISRSEGTVTYLEER